MRFTSKEPGATPWWARRRVLGSALALTALVASGAAANASVNGDGFLNNTAGATTANAAPAAPRAAGANGLGFTAIVNRNDPTFNQALGINDRNVVVGFFGSGANAKHPNRAYWTTAPFTQKTFRAITIPNAVQVQAVGINNNNDIAGFFADRKGANHGFVLWRGHLRVVDFPGTTSRPSFNQLLGINNLGTAAGFFNDKQGNSHGYLFNAKTGKFILLKLPVKTKSFVATGVNDRGQVSGFFSTGRTVSGFIWSPGTFVVVNLGNHSNTQVLGINNAGIVVGSFADARGRTHGFVRVNQKVLRVVDIPGSTSTVVNGLNNRGLIVGFFTDRHKNTLGFVARR